MIREWKDLVIVQSKHSLTRLQERGISAKEIESCFKDPKMFGFCKEGKKKGLWEVYFKRSHKYQLKVIVAEDRDRKELKVVTAYIINKERAKRVQLWAGQRK